MRPTILIFLAITAAAQQNIPEIQFDVLSIRQLPAGAPAPLSNTKPTPNGFISRLSVFQMIMLAYSSADANTFGTLEIRNMPLWSGTFYDINARVREADLKAWQHQSGQQELLRSAMRTALKERCKIAIHWDPGKGEMLELVVGKRGPILQAGHPLLNAPTLVTKLASGGVEVHEVVNGKQVKHFHDATMEDLANVLFRLTRKVPVHDRTGLTGRYDFELREQEPIGEPRDPDYFLNKYPLTKLGLELKHGTEPRSILVIDHIEKPSEN